MNSEKLASLLDETTPQVHLYSSVPSTNLVAKEYAERGEEEGIFIAGAQTAGKGRMGRSFYSPKGSGLYISFLLRPQIAPENIYLLTTTAAVAVCETLEVFTGREARIKWVNDILIADKKVCGILVEGGFTEDKLSYAVIGIGINLFPPDEGFPEELIEKAGAAFKTRKDCVEELTADLIARLYRLLSEDCYDRYVMRSIIQGKEITLINGGEKKEAVVLGLDEKCRLLVRYKSGETERIESGEVSVEGLY